MVPELIVVIGAYGSGKSEYAINLAELYKNDGLDVYLVDLDVVNPYFRSRDVRDHFEKKGINVISPEGDYNYADLPMISPRIAGVVKQQDKVVILDVGGDMSGCRALARFTAAIKERGYKMHFVVNTFRPFTGTTDDITQMLNNLETASKLKITHLISNSNLLGETQECDVLSGIETVKKVAELSNIDFDKYLVLDRMASRINDGLGGKQRMILRYYLQKPWEEVTSKGV